MKNLFGTYSEFRNIRIVFRSCRKYFKLKIKIFVNYKVNMSGLLNLFFIFIRNCVDCRLFADIEFI